MCESVLHQVLEVIGDGSVLARDLNGATHHVSLLALDAEAPAQGTWLVVHSGYAIDRADEADASLALAELSRAQAIVARPPRNRASTGSEHR
jgi:hydrogenase maturation factor